MMLYIFLQTQWFTFERKIIFTDIFDKLRYFFMSETSENQANQLSMQKVILYEKNTRNFAGFLYTSYFSVFLANILNYQFHEFFHQQWYFLFQNSSLCIAHYSEKIVFKLPKFGHSIQLGIKYRKLDFWVPGTSQRMGLKSNFITRF